MKSSMPVRSLGIGCPYQMDGGGQSDRRYPSPTHTIIISSPLMQRSIGAEDFEYRAISYCRTKIDPGKAVFLLWYWAIEKRGPTSMTESPSKREDPRKDVALGSLRSVQRLTRERRYFQH